MRFKAITKQYLFPVVIFLGLAVGGYTLSSKGFEVLTELRQLERVPISKIASILPGEVNVTAIARQEDNALISYYSKTPSLYYHYTKEIEEVDSDGDKSWRLVETKKDSVRFLLEDETGKIRIDHTDSAGRIEWKIPISFQTVISDIKHTERIIASGDELFVFGYAREKNGALDITFNEIAQYTPIISKGSESEARQEMGVSSIVRVWSGLALLSLSVYAFCYIFKIHRIMMYLSILTVVLSLLLLDMGVSMMKNDLMNGVARYTQQKQHNDNYVKALMQQSDAIKNRNIKYSEDRRTGNKTLIDQLQLNLLVAREVLVLQMNRFPERGLYKWWDLTLPEEINISSVMQNKLDNRLAEYTATQLSGTKPEMVMIIALVVSCVMLWLGLRLVKIKRYIENVSTSDAAGVAYGLCEVKGRLVIEPDTPLLVSPVSHTECAWYYYKEEEKRENGDDEKWVTLKKEYKSLPIYCEDDTGKVEVLPEKASVITEHSKVVRSGGKRYTEKLLMLDDELYVLGNASTDNIHNNKLSIQYSSKREPFIISNKGEREVMLEKAHKGILSLNIAFSAIVLAALTGFGMSGGFAAADFLTSALMAPLMMLLIMFVLHYNDIVFLRQRVDRNASNINVSLKKRFNLIPEIENIVKQYAVHEAELLESLVAVRKAGEQALEMGKLHELADGSKSLNVKLKKLQEDYPDLKSNELIMNMINLLSHMENEIMYMRTGYNDAVEIYNSRIKSVPDILFTKIFGFTEKSLIQT